MAARVARSAAVLPLLAALLPAAAGMGPAFCGEVEGVTDAKTPRYGAELAAFEEDGLPELIEVQIPEGLGAGDGFDIDIDGQLLSVEVPEGLVAGDTIAVQRPATCG